MNKYNLLKDAIMNRLSVEAEYDGKSRILCPHIIGIKDHKEQCLFLQAKGESKTGLSNKASKNWRCMELSKLFNVSISDYKWETASNFSQWSSCLDNIDISV